MNPVSIGCRQVIRRHRKITVQAFTNQGLFTALPFARRDDEVPGESASLHGLIVTLNRWPVRISDAAFAVETASGFERPFVHLREFGFHDVFGFMV